MESTKQNFATEYQTMYSNKTVGVTGLADNHVSMSVPDVDDIDLSSEEMISGTAAKINRTTPAPRPSNLGTVRLPTAAVSY